MKNLYLLFICAVFGLVACATATPYQEASLTGKGYRDQKLDENKYRVSFKGNRLTERETVENYLIYRAAEVTAKSGYEYFAMSRLDTERKTDYRTAPIIYGHYANFGPFPYYLYGGGYPMGTPAATSASTEYEAVAYVIMTDESNEADKEIYYNAKEVIKNLEPIIERKKKD